MPRKSPKPPLRKKPRWQLFYAGLILGLFSTISLGRFGVGPRIGDGTGFYMMLFSWAENGTPWSNERVGKKFVDYAAPRPAWAGQQHYYSDSNAARQGGTAEEAHFWLYSMLAAVFYWPLKTLGADVGLSFNCLHIVLLYIAVVLAHRRLGPAGALSMIILVVGSPVLWYANKAHTELFTVVLGSLGAAYLVTESHAAAAICFALVATQNPAFGLVALLAAAFGFVSRGGKSMLADWKLLAVAAALLALHPAYYLFRAREASPMLNGHDLTFGSHWLPLKHMAAFWIDPDMGLLTTWPLGLPLAIAAAAMLIHRRSRRRIEYVVFCLLASLLLTWTYARLPNGFGGGGTVDVSRYSVWLIFLFYPVLWRVLAWLAQFIPTRSASEGPNRKASIPTRSASEGSPTAPRWRVGLVSVLAARSVNRVAVIAGLSLVGLSAWLYRPSLDERYRRPTPLSTWLYANVSNLYDPLPRVFYDSRGGRRDVTGEDASRCCDWAVSDDSGNKVLVLREAFERQEADNPAVVFGRGCLDSKALYAVARDYFAQRTTADFCYVDGRARELFAPPPLALGQQISFVDHESQIGRGERFLAAGWYPPEANGTWTRGDRAEIVFAPIGVDSQRSYAIRLEIAQVVGTGHTPLMLTPLVNGAPLARAEVTGPCVLHWPVSGQKLSTPTRLVLTIATPASPQQLGQGSDTRQLGVKIGSLRVQALGK